MATRIRGLIKDSFGVISGRLFVQLQSPLVDRTTVPTSLYLPIERPFDIKDGVVDIQLPATQKENITYQFRFSKMETQTIYRDFEGGTYVGPTIDYNGATYSGGYYDAEKSVRLFKETREAEKPLWKFNSLIPDVEVVEFNDLIPSGVTGDRLSTGVRQIAHLIASEPGYKKEIADAVLKFVGDYKAQELYMEQVAVFYNGSTWVNIADSPHSGNKPERGSKFWQILAAGVAQ